MIEIIRSTRGGPPRPPLAASDNHSLTRLVEALVSSADHRATYPRQDVIAEADALL